jgi:hypothetical protein
LSLDTKAFLARGTPFLFARTGLEGEETEKKGPLMALRMRRAG